MLDIAPLCLRFLKNLARNRLELLGREFEDTP